MPVSTGIIADQLMSATITAVHMSTSIPQLGERYLRKRFSFHSCSVRYSVLLHLPSGIIVMEYSHKKWITVTKSGIQSIKSGIQSIKSGIQSRTYHVFCVNRLVERCGFELESSERKKYPDRQYARWDGGWP